ncbi:MAG: tyrosine-type recombinase/integrase [Trueperaceae bacterium]
MARWDRDPATERMLDDFLVHQQAVAGLADRTLINYQSNMRNFAAWWRGTGGGDLGQVQPADIESWLIAETERGMRPRTRETALGAVRAFYRWLRPDEPNPADAVRSPNSVPRPVDPYRPDEARRILETVAQADTLSGAFDHAVLATLRWTGIRVAELAGLRLDRLDLQRRRAKVVGKGRRPRTVPVPLPLAEHLTRYLDDVRPHCPPSGFVFANPRSLSGSARQGTIDRQGVRDLCRRAGERAAIEGRHHPHRWRHSYATELLRGGVDVHVVQRLLGHSHLESTTRYLHLLDTDLRAAIDRTYPPPDRLIRRRIVAPATGEQLSLEASVIQGEAERG